MIRNKIVLLCLLICLHLLAGAQTPAPVKWLLQAPYMRGASFSLVVKDVQEGRTVYSYDTDRLQSPASVLKTVATATALEILGEDYRYPTTLEYDGILENGTLEGNLYIKGSGDPSLGSSHFAPGQNKFLSTWIAALQKAGIKHITGSVISDESIFDTEGVSIKWLREDMGNYYAPGSYGISIFDNMYKLSLQTHGGPAGEQALPQRGREEAGTDADHHQQRADARAEPGKQPGGSGGKENRALSRTLPEPPEARAPTRAARQDCPTEMWSSPVFFCRNGPCRQQKKPRGACGTLRGAQ